MLVSGVQQSAVLCARAGPCWRSIFCTVVCMLIPTGYLLKLFIFLLHHTARGVLVPQQEVEPRPLTVRTGSSNHRTTRESPAGYSQ